MPFILAKKIEMTQIFQNGQVVPVTLLQAGPCVITQIKTKDKPASAKATAGKDGYDAVQLGFLQRTKRLKKSEHKKPFKHLREFRVSQQEAQAEKLDVADELTVAIFNEGDIVKVAGISKGKGFQGGVKRWGFSGRNQTHGVKHEHRTIGSVGASGPGRVFKGKHMPGRMGYDRTTVKNLKIVKIDKENNILAIKGAVPGRRGTVVEVST